MAERRNELLLPFSENLFFGQDSTENDSVRLSISPKDKHRIHQLGDTMLSGKFLGYALHTGDRWSGDLLIADWDEVEKKIALEVHVKRFKSPEAQVTTVQGTYIFPCAAGSLEPEGRARLTTFTLLAISKRRERRGIQLWRT